MLMISQFDLFGASSTRRGREHKQHGPRWRDARLAPSTWSDDELLALRAGMLVECLETLKESPSEDYLRTELAWVFARDWHAFSFDACCAAVGHDPDVYRYWILILFEDRYPELRQCGTVTLPGDEDDEDRLLFGEEEELLLLETAS